MCWISNICLYPDCGKNSVADRDITVYKIAGRHSGDEYVMPWYHRGSGIKFGTADNYENVAIRCEIIESEMTFQTSGRDLYECAICKNGLHSFTCDAPVNFTKENTCFFQHRDELELMTDDPYVINTPNGKYYMNLGKEAYLMKCVIPKGAEYRINENHHVVSNKLDVIGVEHIEKTPKLENVKGSVEAVYDYMKKYNCNAQTRIRMWICTPEII